MGIPKIIKVMFVLTVDNKKNGTRFLESESR